MERPRQTLTYFEREPVYMTNWIFSWGPSAFARFGKPIAMACLAALYGPPATCRSVAYSRFLLAFARDVSCLLLSVSAPEPDCLAAM